MNNIMKLELSANVIARGLCMGALLFSATVASAQSTVSFQVDMSNNPLTAGENMSVNGSFDGWTANHLLTNNQAAANPNLYSGTVTNTSVANGKVMDYQYRIINGTSTVSYSSQADNDNYCLLIPANGSPVAAPYQFWSDDGTAVTNTISFQVDMAEQLHLGTFNTSYPVYAYGSFGNWAVNPLILTNNPALNVTNAQGYITSFPYQGTLTTWAASTNAAAEFKYVYNNGGDVYEGPATGDPDNNNNRFFVNTPQTLPLVSFSDTPFSNTVTNDVTFIVDMSIQTYTGNFLPASETIQIFGDYNNWASGTVMVNTNANNTNLYYFSTTYVGGAGSHVYFKYQINPGSDWENPAASNTIGGNRYYTLAATTGSFIDGPVYFSDLGPSSLADDVNVTNCMVTFTVDMTPAVNGSVDANLDFTIGVDTVMLNGLWNGLNPSFWTWGASSPSSYPQYVMTNIPGGNLYTITLPVNQGQPLNLSYDYGIDGEANEPNGNHSHYIRSIPNYTMPTDVFGAPAPGEASFGNLTMTKANKQVSLSWLGRTGVSLQRTTNLNPPIVWTPLPLTDGTNLTVNQGPGTTPPIGYATTNYPIGGSNVFYELIGPK
jgi:hypothetical protein